MNCSINIVHWLQRSQIQPLINLIHTTYHRYLQSTITFPHRIPFPTISRDTYLELLHLIFQENEHLFTPHQHHRYLQNLEYLSTATHVIISDAEDLDHLYTLFVLHQIPHNINFPSQ